MMDIGHATAEPHDDHLAGEVLHALRAIDGAVRVRDAASADAGTALIVAVAADSVQCRGTLAAAVGISAVVPHA